MYEYGGHHIQKGGVRLDSIVGVCAWTDFSVTRRICPFSLELYTTAVVRDTHGRLVFCAPALYSHVED